MLKIKEERMQDLVNFGFEYYKMMCYYIKEIDSNISFEVNAYTRELEMIVEEDLDEREYLNDGLDLLYDMIKDDMIEKEEW